jgi:hypothetical protein
MVLAILRNEVFGFGLVHPSVNLPGLPRPTITTCYMYVVTVRHPITLNSRLVSHSHALTITGRLWSKPLQPRDGGYCCWVGNGGGRHDGWVDSTLGILGVACAVNVCGYGYGQWVTVYGMTV